MFSKALHPDSGSYLTVKVIQNQIIELPVKNWHWLGWWPPVITMTTD